MERKVRRTSTSSRTKVHRDGRSSGNVSGLETRAGDLPGMEVTEHKGSEENKFGVERRGAGSWEKIKFNTRMRRRTVKGSKEKVRGGRGWVPERKVFSNAENGGVVLYCHTVSEAQVRGKSRIRRGFRGR